MEARVDVRRLSVAPPSGAATGRTTAARLPHAIIECDKNEAVIGSSNVNTASGLIQWQSQRVTL